MRDVGARVRADPAAISPPAASSPEARDCLNVLFQCGHTVDHSNFVVLAQAIVADRSPGLALVKAEILASSLLISSFGSLILPPLSDWRALCETLR
jgi:hypothetical protein